MIWAFLSGVALGLALGMAVWTVALFDARKDKP